MATTYPTLPNFKPGGTFSLTCTYFEDDVAEPVTGITIEAQVRTSRDVLVATLEPELANQTTSPGVFVLTPILADEDTSEWPLGTLLIDIRFTEDGVIRYSATFAQPVVKRITHD